jgi:hypothetical protein
VDSYKVAHPKSEQLQIDDQRNTRVGLLQMGGIYDVAVEMNSGGMMYSLHDDRFRHWSDITVITATIWEALMLVLLI